MRLAITALVMALGMSLGAAQWGCAHPYSGKPERLKKPRKKDKPEPTEEEVAEGELEFDEKCRTNFFAEPTSLRKTRLSRRLARRADNMLVKAEEEEGQARISAVKDALSKLNNALKADPYGPVATYKMAVAYALVGKKGCALALLERLQQLTRHPEAMDEAERVVNRALRDHNFDPFRKDADTALGR